MAQVTATTAGGLVPRLKQFRELVIEIGALGGVLGSAGYGLSTYWERLEAVLGFWGVLALAALLVTISAFALYRWLIRRASRIQQIALIESDVIEGREKESAAWVEHVVGASLVWLRGESGSGKSTLLRLGVVPRVLTGRRLLPVYINYWRGDWVDGPYEAAARELNLARGSANLIDKESFEAACRDYEGQTGLRPLFIFDQFDDYQSLHHHRFIDDTFATISPLELIQLNPFWKTIAALVADGAIHCVFASRSDSAYGLDCVRFVPSLRDTYLGRLPPAVARQLLDRIVPLESVEHPEAGWNEFAACLCQDLEREGTLAVQMARVFRSLRQYRKVPIRSGFYEHIGGLLGVESSFVQYHVREAARASGCSPQGILQALVALIDPRTLTKTRVMTTREIAEIVARPDCGPDAIARALEYLADPSQEIVRRLGPTMWVLDHDYLTHVVIALREREAYSATLLRQRGDRFRASTGWGKMRALLSPRQWLRVFWDWLRGIVPLGQNAWFFTLSSIRLILPWPAVVLALVLGVGWLARESQRNEEKAGNDALQVFQTISTPAGGNDNGQYAKLYGLPRRERLYVLENIVRDRAAAITFVTLWTTYDLSAALLHFDEPTRIDGLERIRPECDRLLDQAVNPRDDESRIACHVLLGHLTSDVQATLKLGETAVGSTFVGAPLQVGWPVKPLEEASLRAEAGTALAVLKSSLTSRSSFVDGETLAALASRLSDDARKAFLADVLKLSRSSEAGWLTSPILAALASRVPAETRSDAVSKLLEPLDDKVCSQGTPVGADPARRCFPTWFWPDAWYLASLEQPGRQDIVKKIVDAVEGRCVAFQAPQPGYTSSGLSVMSDDFALMTTRALMKPGWETCLSRFLASEGFPSAFVANALTNQERANVYAQASTLADDARAAFATGLSESQADAEFDKIVNVKEPTWQDNQPATLAALLLKVSPERVNRIPGQLGPLGGCRQQGRSFLCAAVELQRDPGSSVALAELIRSNLNPAVVRRFATEVYTGPARAVLKEFGLFSLDSSSPYTNFDVEAQVVLPLIERLGADGGAWLSDTRAAWSRSSEAERASAISRARSSWAAVLTDEELRRSRELFLNTLSQIQPTFDPAWHQLLERVEPNPMERARFALDLFVATFGAPANGDTGLLRYLTLETEALAWERMRDVWLHWGIRHRLAQRLCEIHKSDKPGPETTACTIDARDRWAFVEWARRVTDIDYSKVPAAPAVPGN